jgi:hypothetical protein
MDVEVDFNPAVFEVEDWSLVLVVVRRSRSGKLRLEKVDEGLREGWLVAVGVVRRV